MKRILPLILTVLLFPSLLIVPARAESFYDSNFVNILDLASANNYGTNFFDFTGSTTVTYDLGNPQVFSNVDIILYSTSPISSASISDDSGNSFDLAIYQIDVNHFRLFGNLSYYGFSRLNLSLISQYPDVRTFAEVLSFRASPSAIAVQDIGVSGVAHTGLSGTIKTEFNNNTVGWLIAESPDYSCEITLVPLEWKQYDFLTIYLKHDAYEINSISADLDLLPIPYEVDYLDRSTTPNEFRYAITLDLRGLDRTRNIYPNVRIQCRLSPNEDSMFQIINAAGYVFTDAPNPLITWYRRILADMNTHFNNLRTSFSNGLAQLGNNIASGFTSLGDRIHSSLGSVFNAHFKWLTDDIALWAQKIIDAIGGTGDSSQLQDDLNNAVGSLDQAGEAMNSVQRPDIGQFNFDVSAMVPASGISAVGSLVGLVYQNEVFGPIILMFFTLSLAAFVIFGRR